MTSIDALQTEALQLPKQYHSISFLDFIRKTLTDYLTTIDSIDEGTIVKAIKAEKKNFEDFCDGLLEAFHQLYLGVPSKSYFYFEQGISKVEQYFDSSVTHPLSEGRLYFRARSNSSALVKEEMFHLPFQFRHLATTQRFSIPGFPCLYLANSSYVCWEELNRPAFDNFYVSRFQIREFDGYLNLRTLDISSTPQRITKMIRTVTEKGEDFDSWDKLLLEYFAKWPLIFCCSIKVLFENATFKPEYVIPQYLLQWIRLTQRKNSIKYFSVKSNINQQIDFSSFVNVAIPVQEVKESGHCLKLRDSFQYTDPICLGNLDLTAEISKEDISNYIINFRPDPTYLLSPLKEIGGKYIMSPFGRLEIELCKMNAS